MPIYSRTVIEEVIATHSVLRTHFDLASYSEPIQLVFRLPDSVVEVEDIQDLSEAQQDAMLERWLDEEKGQPLSLSKPLRFRIHQRSKESLQFTQINHHALLDGWSVASLHAEIFRRYLSALKGNQTPIQYGKSSFRDFVGLERQTLRSKEAREYWERRRSDFTADGDAVESSWKC